MRTRKQILADFYLDLLAMPEHTITNNFTRLREETLLALANELDSQVIVVKTIFDRMAQEDQR